MTLHDCHYIELHLRLLTDGCRRPPTGTVKAKVYFKLPELPPSPDPATSSAAATIQDGAKVTLDELCTKLKRGLTEFEAGQPNILSQSSVNPSFCGDSLLNFNTVFDEDNNAEQFYSYVDVNMRVPLKIIAIHVEECDLRFGGMLTRVTAGEGVIHSEENGMGMRLPGLGTEPPWSDDPSMLQWHPHWTRKVGSSVQVSEDGDGTLTRSHWIYAPPFVPLTPLSPEKDGKPQYDFRKHKEYANFLRFEFTWNGADIQRMNFVSVETVKMWTKPHFTSEIEVPALDTSATPESCQLALDPSLDFEKLPSLPVEVWKQILSKVPSKIRCLLALSGTCKKWRSLFAHPVFYWVIDFRPLATLIPSISDEAVSFLAERCRQNGGVVRHIRASWVLLVAKREFGDLISELVPKGQLISFVSENAGCMDVCSLHQLIDEQPNIETLSLVGNKGLWADGDSYIRVPKLTKLRRIEIGRTRAVPALFFHKLAKYCHQLEAFSIYEVDDKHAEAYYPGRRALGLGLLEVSEVSEDPDLKDSDFRPESLPDAIRTCLTRIARRKNENGVPLRAINFSTADGGGMASFFPEVYNVDVRHVGGLMKSCGSSLEEIYAPSGFAGGDLLKICRYMKVNSLGQLCPRLRRMKGVEVTDKTEDDEDDEMGEDEFGDVEAEDDSGGEKPTKCAKSEKEKKDSKGARSKPVTRIGNDMFGQVVGVFKGLNCLTHLAIEIRQTEPPVSFVDIGRLLENLPSLRHLFIDLAEDDLQVLRERFPQVEVELKKETLENNYEDTDDEDTDDEDMYDDEDTHDYEDMDDYYECIIM